MLHAGMAPPFAYRMVEDVVGRRRAECFHIAETEAPDGLSGKLELRDGQKIEPAQLIRRALAFRIEAADSLQRIAEKIEPHRFAHTLRVNVDHTSPHRLIAPF